MTTEKRVRIFDMIVGMILLFSAFSSIKTTFRLFFPANNGIDAKGLPYFFLEALQHLCPLFIGLLIITRKYDKSWAKIGLLVTAVLYSVFSSGLLNIIRRFFNSSFREFENKNYSSSETALTYISFFLSFLIVIVGAAAALLTMCRKIEWKSGKKLLIYTYIMLGILAVIIHKINPFNYTAAIIILLPCFMYAGASRRDAKGIAGEAAVLLTPFVFRIMRAFVSWIHNSENPQAYSFFNGNTAAIDLSGLDYYSASMWLISILLLLMPLMLFERRYDPEKASATVSNDNKD